MRGIVVDENLILPLVATEQCINKESCMGCKKSYHDYIYLTRTGIGFCSKACMETFIDKWRCETDDIQTFLIENESSKIHSKERDRLFPLTMG